MRHQGIKWRKKLRGGLARRRVVEAGHEDAGRGLAGAFVVVAEADEGGEAEEGVVLGVDVEEVVAVLGDLLDGGEAGADVGLGGPVRELYHGESEVPGDLGEAGLTLEPSVETGVVGAGEGGFGMGEGGGHSGRVYGSRTWCQ